MITDLVQIQTLGEKKRQENERFRRHLKSRDHSDRILRRIAEGDASKGPVEQEKTEALT